nr:baseplate J/gp47 family protein [uncultured Roseococcus sp.]
MAFPRPTLDTLRRDARSAFEAHLPGADAALRFSVLKVVSDVVAGQTHLTFGYLDWIARQVIPDTAQADFLDRWAGLHGIPRRPATRAAGLVSLTGIEGAVLPQGSRLTRPDGTGYITTAPATLGSLGTATVSVEAEAGGEAGNAGPNVALTLSVAIVGLSGTALVGADGLSGGKFAESDDSLRARLVARLSSPPQGGAKRDYEAWALTVPGVSRAWVYPRNRGNGTVDVAFVMDARTNIIPLVADVAAVQAAIDPLRPVTADCIVFAPVAVPLNVTISGLSPDTLAVRAAIRVELDDQLRRDAEPGGTIHRSRLIEAVSRASGENYHVMSAPVGDVVHAAGHIAVLGTVAFV